MAKQDAGISVDGQYTIADCEINVGDFPVSHCIVMFPESIWSGIGASVAKTGRSCETSENT